MTEEYNWVSEARQRVKDSSEVNAYEKFLKEYQHNEKEGGKRSKRRTRRVSLKSDWCIDDLEGKSILVFGENGIGDRILTASCLCELVKYCGRVTWKCDPKLKVLFTRNFPNVGFISDGDPTITEEGTIYSWELIGRFRRNLDDFPWVNNSAQFTPYLRPSKPLRDCLYARYSDGSKKVVGIAWRSERNGELQSNKTCDIRDTPHWANFYAELKNNVRFVSLQYGETNDDIAFAHWKYGVDIYQDQSIDIFNDVDAAAAQVAAMDYVVSISTTTAHLAGAVGVPGYVLLPKKAIPHWRAGDNICPWYPTLRPIRQTIAGDWKPVLNKVTCRLKELVSEN